MKVITHNIINFRTVDVLVEIKLYPSHNHNACVGTRERAHYRLNKETELHNMRDLDNSISIYNYCYKVVYSPKASFYISLEVEHL